MANELSLYENPYWHSEGQQHPIDLEAIRRICFEIFNIMAASGALAGQFEFWGEVGEDPENSLLLKLHHELAESRALELLLSLASLVRTYDDVMKQSEHADAYAAHASNSDGEDYIGTLDTGSFTLREACNKIIHAQEVRPIYESVELEPEKNDEAARLWHLDGQIELTGILNKKKWEAVLYVPPFLEIVLDRISFGWGQKANDAEV